MTKEEIIKAKKCYQYLSCKSHDNLISEKEVSNIIECDDYLKMFISKVEKLQCENEELRYDCISYQERYQEESEYGDTLFKKNKKQNEILNIMKWLFSEESITFYKQKTYGININDICLYFKSKEQYEIIKEWIEND